MIREGSGKREMDHIPHAVVGEMIVTEQDLLHTRRDAVENYSRITMYAGAAGLMFCVGILALVFLYQQGGPRIVPRRSRRCARRLVTWSATTGKRDDFPHGRLFAQLRTEDEAYGMIAANMPTLFPETYGSVTLFNNSRNLVQTVLTWGAALWD